MQEVVGQASDLLQLIEHVTCRRILRAKPLSTESMLRGLPGLAANNGDCGKDRGPTCFEVGAHRNPDSAVTEYSKYFYFSNCGLFPGRELATATTSVS